MNKFAFASDDRQITLSTADGTTFGQVRPEPSTEKKKTPENIFAATISLSYERYASGQPQSSSPLQQVKVKSRPTDVQFGGSEEEGENMVTVSMDRRTLLLYNLDDPENAFELAFQQRYASKLTFQGFLTCNDSYLYARLPFYHHIHCCTACS